MTLTGDIKERLHQKIFHHSETLERWYEKELSNSYIPFYSSFDIRDGGFKLGNVDGNIFPAGFNNICQSDKESAPELVRDFLDRYFPGIKNILILAENHLRNLYYWDNVATLSHLLKKSGYGTCVGVLGSPGGGCVPLTSFSGAKINVENVFSQNGLLQVEGFQPDLVVANNDFSSIYKDVDFSKTPMTPSQQLGWFQRKKNDYFSHYNKKAQEFAEILEEDPWLFSVETALFKDFKVQESSSLKSLSDQVDELLSRVRVKYKEHGILEDPYVFVKNNSGTYGLGVVEAYQGSDVLHWNYKLRKKMKASKGGQKIQEVVVQEGIPSILSQEKTPAEPVIYMLGG